MSAALGLPLPDRPPAHRRARRARLPRARPAHAPLPARARGRPPACRRCSSGLRLPELARAHVARLAAETGETVNLAVLQDGEIVYLLSESGGRLLGTRTPVGTRLPAPLHRARQVPARPAARRRRRATPSGPEPYERAHGRRRSRPGRRCSAALERIRRDGVAQSWEEYEIGLASIAVPVGWLDGPGSAALNVSLPTSRATRAFRSELVARLREIAARIEASLAAHGH